MKLRLAYSHLALFCGLVALYIFGWLQSIFLADQTGLVYGIAGIGAISALCLFLGRIDWAEHLKKQAVMWGLIGTVLGIFFGLQDVDVQAMGDKQAALEAMTALISGLGTALTTTLVGALVWSWINFNLKLVGYEGN